ncbi:HCP-like protein [Rhizophagus irregularis]|uniref:HCP-like protein n=2 Tax=Rhizophagus irregularis TaxID=588596 RepID=A0A2N1NYL8_9GLOM|nr:HCP-like protein [Rhizophagus irregularis]
MELNELVNEIVQGYLRKNNNGTTKTFDFEHILRKFESQSTCLFNHLKNNPSKIHYEVVIGIFYKRGFGVEKSEKESFDQFKNASQKGDINSHYELGECFYNGTGTKKDFDKAFEYYKFAADKGLNIALFTLAKYYYNSFGVDKDEKESFEWFSKASQKNDINGHFELGECYYNGIGIGKDCKKALYYYTLAANKGLNIALCNLAEYFMNSKNKRKAFSYYKKAAKSGFVQSQYYLARCYNNKKRNIKKSLSWLKKYQENDGSWEISDEITKVEKQLVDQVMCFFSVSLSD